MDFQVDVGDVGALVLQELWNKVASGAKELSSEMKDTTLENKSFRKFSNQLTELDILLQTLHARRVEIMSSGSARIALESLHSHLERGCKIIRTYKSGSQLRLIIDSHCVLKQMHELAAGIAETISSLQLANLDAALNLKAKTEKIINNLRTIEFRSAAATENIASEIENSMNQNEENQGHMVELLHKIAGAVGVNMNASLIQEELALLKREKEEMEEQKNQAEAFQLSQLIELLHNSEMVQSPPEEPTTNQQTYVESFTCPLCHELMTDPVAIVCGHSFERRSIEEHFTRGESNCPICKQELSSLELTPNHSLRSTIEEWKQRETDLKFEGAVSAMESSNHEILKKALGDLQALIRVPRYGAMATEKQLIAKMVNFIKPGTPNASVALQCLCHLSTLCDENKEAIVHAGAIRYIVKRLYREVEPEAITILLGLSEKQTLAEQIGNAQDSIPILVSLLHRNNPVSEKAKEVLQNLSWNTHFVIKMAEAGYYLPFITRFNQGSSDARASMAAALVTFQISDNSIANFEHKQFVRKLIQMLTGSPACRMASIRCIKKLLVYQKMVKLFLADTTISLLIGVISFVNSEERWKLEATEVLTSLIETSQLPDFQKYPDLQELQSEHNVNLFKRLATTSDAQLKVHFLQLLFVLADKSETARNLVRSDKDAVAKLFSSLPNEQPEVRQRIMKLIYCICEDHPAGVPLPESPAKEHAINALVTLLISSPDIKEKSTAAGIISLLPAEDIIVDKILSRSEALKAIQEVICTTDNEHFRIKSVTNSDESLLENALAVLLRYTQPTKPELQRQVCELELYTSLVRVLSMGSSLAKQRTATALAHLSQSTNLSLSNATIISRQANFSTLLNRLFPGLAWCCSPLAPNKSTCSVHGIACSSRHTFCLVKADAVGPLLQTLSDTESGAAEAALTALNTLLTGHNTLSDAVTTIVDNQGVAAILEVLERGNLSAKDKALDLLEKILQHTDITNTQTKRSERILIHLLSDNAIKKKAALVLRQMNLLPEQSSYF